MRIIVHGGAYNIPENLVEAHLTGVRRALNLGKSLLEDGMSAVDIVEKVVVDLENDPTFDAGTGSHLNMAGEVEMDALIGTPDFRIGAVAAIQMVKNPISVARKVRDDSEHVLLVGRNAVKFAESQKLEIVPARELVVRREEHLREDIKSRNEFHSRDAFTNKGFGTVGCVVVDDKGNYAIGVSTGGTPGKTPGRVGDTPIWGAGGYAERNAACAATGYGEDLIRTTISKRVVDYTLSGMSTMDACGQAVHDLESLVNGRGGVIAICNGEIGFAYNTPKMAYGYIADEFVVSVK